MIITHLLGGLGNQMFQYAAGLSLAHQHRTVLKMDPSWFQIYEEYESHNRYGLDCFNITEQFATQDEIKKLKGTPLTRTERWSVALAKIFRLRQYAEQFEKKGNAYFSSQHNFFPEFFDIPDHTYLGGMFQSEEFFKPIEPILRLHFSFRYPMPDAVKRMSDQMRSGGPSVAVHFRRGDYVKNPEFRKKFGIVPMSYYEEALKKISKEVGRVKLFVFSDDLQAVRQEFDPPDCVFVDVVQPWHAYDKIRLMSMCDHAIISNSTFAWWGAWLNSNPDKKIIAPDPWFINDPEGPRKIVSDSWTKLSIDS